jgi:hypothetical protein
MGSRLRETLVKLVECFPSDLWAASRHLRVMEMVQISAHPGKAHGEAFGESLRKGHQFSAWKAPFRAITNATLVSWEVQVSTEVSKNNLQSEGLHRITPHGPHGPFVRLLVLPVSRQPIDQ